MKESEVKEETELVIICAYCGVLLKGPENCDEDIDNDSIRKSHGVCPACLLENYPNEYLSIQKRWRIRIKNEYKNGYPDLDHKLKMGKWNNS